ncbi:amino acid ABC transporter permease [Georgenia sp. TF02-10]|uniref:amino acid ABC transporter permease n=1 Tax=Georgenia sp. TF02-10 TaxID=2917725 RepID=UPI001FA7D8D2|nr:amino acid ABC transporter permease [Georgenia sp. TF02-10]UNX55944.1 amino acid ABC transporter permease [Georgenia sp. TF02-10]
MGGIVGDVAELLGSFDVLGAFIVNIRLTLYSAVFAFLIGTVLAIMRVSPAPSLQWAGAAYVNVVRNTPLTLIILACSLGLWGQLGVVLAGRDAPGGFITANSFRLAVLGLSVYTAAFVCEALRSGVNTVPAGQVEAARALGLGFGQSMRLVILPQALRGAIAPLGNTLIALAKNSTVAQAAGVTQAAGVMLTMLELRPDLRIVIFLVIALGWVVIVLPIGLLATFLSRRLGVAR